MTKNKLNCPEYHPYLSKTKKVQGQKMLLVSGFPWCKGSLHL